MICNVMAAAKDSPYWLLWRGLLSPEPSNVNSRFWDIAFLLKGTVSQDGYFLKV
jgi:hypothetical protein